jgi:hypothetical protein
MFTDIQIKYHRKETSKINNFLSHLVIRSVTYSISDKMGRLTKQNPIDTKASPPYMAFHLIPSAPLDRTTEAIAVGVEAVGVVVVVVSVPGIVTVEV